MSDNQKASPPNTPNTLQALNASKEAILVDASQAAGNLAGQALDRIEGTLSQKKGAAAESIGSIATAVRQTKQGLKGVGPLPDLAEKAAGGIEKVADYFETRSVAGVVRDVETFARREPALFLGGAFALGLVGGRFLKSSARPSKEEGADHDGADHQAFNLGPRPAKPTAPNGGAGYGGAGYGVAGNGVGSGVAGTPKPVVAPAGSPMSPSRDGARPIPPGRM